MNEEFMFSFDFFTSFLGKIVSYSVHAAQEYRNCGVGFNFWQVKNYVYVLKKVNGKRNIFPSLL